MFTVIDVKETKLFGPPELGYVRPSLRLSVLLSFHLSVLLFASFLGIGSLVFSETQHVFTCLCVIVHDSRIFFFLFYPQNGENGPKIGFLGFIGKFSH